jgi:release factor glutamine methyltransferase
MALFVENDSPIIFYQKIAENALRYLKPNGYLFFEIHERFAKEVLDDLIQKGFVNCEVKKDLQGKDRMVKAQKKD